MAKKKQKTITFKVAINVDSFGNIEFETNEQCLDQKKFEPLKHLNTDAGGAVMNVYTFEVQLAVPPHPEKPKAKKIKVKKPKLVKTVTPPPDFEETPDNITSY